MVFDIQKVGDEGLDFKFQIYKDQFKIDQGDCSLNKNVSVDGRLFRVGDDIYLKGNINTELILECSRCLDQFNYPVDSRLKAHFVPSSNNSNLTGEVELHASDIDVEVYKDKRIDLAQSIRDRILLAVPFFCLCMEDCKGICPRCGTYLNERSCECASDSSIDPRLELLKKLKNKLT